MVKFLRQIMILGIGGALLWQIPFFVFDFFNPIVDIVLQIAGGILISRLVSIYYRNIKGRCLICGHGEYYHTIHKIPLGIWHRSDGTEMMRGLEIPSCFHIPGNVIPKMWLDEFLGTDFVKVQPKEFCHCEKYITKAMIKQAGKIRR